MKIDGVGNRISCKEKRKWVSLEFLWKGTRETMSLQFDFISNQRNQCNSNKMFENNKKQQNRVYSKFYWHVWAE